MSKIPDSNMPVFPCKEYGNYGSLGLELRDYFAAYALNGIIANPVNPSGGRSAENHAKLAYEMADAMLKERQK